VRQTSKPGHCSVILRCQTRAIVRRQARLLEPGLMVAAERVSATDLFLPFCHLSHRCDADGTRCSGPPLVSRRVADRTPRRGMKPNCVAGESGLSTGRIRQEPSVRRAGIDVGYLSVRPVPRAVRLVDRAARPRRGRRGRVDEVSDQARASISEATPGAPAPNCRACSGTPAQAARRSAARAHSLAETICCGSRKGRRQKARDVRSREIMQTSESEILARR